MVTLQQNTNIMPRTNRFRRTNEQIPQCVPTKFGRIVDLSQNKGYCMRNCANLVHINPQLSDDELEIMLKVMPRSMTEPYKTLSVAQMPQEYGMFLSWQKLQDSQTNEMFGNYLRFGLEIAYYPTAYNLHVYGLNTQNDEAARISIGNQRIKISNAKWSFNSTSDVRYGTMVVLNEYESYRGQCISAVWKTSGDFELKNIAQHLIDELGFVFDEETKQYNLVTKIKNRNHITATIAVEQIEDDYRFLNQYKIVFRNNSFETSVKN